MGYKEPRTVCLNYQANVGSQNPNDATTYYIGYNQDMGTTVNARKIYLPFSGFIRGAVISSYAITAAGTGEDWTISLYDGTTTTAIATVGLATAERTWSNYALNYRVTQGGYIMVTMTTPTWVTNPEGMRWNICLFIEVT